MTTEKKAVLILSVVLGISGILLVGFNSSWWVAVGVFVMLFGNNVGNSGR